MSEITLDVGLAYKIKQALSRNGIPDVADLDWLATGDNIAKVRRVRLGHAEITIPEHIIDCDADPFLPDGWKVEEHQKGGIIKWAELSIALYLDKGQKNGKYIVGNELRQALKGQKVLNVNVLDFLLKHPELIPEEWKGKAIFFWGTIYRHSDGRLYVRYLDWFGGRWSSNYFWLGYDWFGADPAAVRAS